MNPIPLLLVEDNPVYADVLQRLLPHLGVDLRFEVTWVENAEQALAAVARDRYELMLLDYRLPGADGLSVLAAIHNLPPAHQPAVIMLTGMGREEVAVEAMKRGAKDYLSKDHLDVASLLRAITSALERRRLESELARYTEELRERNAQLQADLNMAREIQEAFLPQAYPAFPSGVPEAQSALRFHHRYLPTTTVGGDFFDVIRLPGDKAGVFLSDVMGHGVRAALVMSALRTLAEELEQSIDDPGLFLGEINRRLLGLLRRTRMPMFASACYLVIDPHVGTVRFSLAGHPIPFHVRRALGKVDALPVPTGAVGPALGVLDHAQYDVLSAPLDAGDLIVLYTDGLFEVADARGELYGQPRIQTTLQRLVQSPTQTLFSELLDDVHHFSARREFADDVCLLGVDITRIGGS